MRFLIVIMLIVFIPIDSYGQFKRNLNLEIDQFFKVSAPEFLSNHQFKINSFQNISQHQSKLFTFLPSMAFPTESENRKINKRKIVQSALIYTLPFALMGAAVGAKTNCSGTEYVTCYPKERSFVRAFALGGILGASLGFVNQKKEINKKYSLKRVLCGAIIGGAVQYAIVNHHYHEPKSLLFTFPLPALAGWATLF